MTGRRLVVDGEHPGTPEEVWVAHGGPWRAAPLAIGDWRQAVVVAPHPDDEVLGAGGLIRALARHRVPLGIVAVTDGEASHPGSPAAARLDLVEVRAGERADALRRLLGTGVATTRLGLPDGGVPAGAATVAAHLRQRLGPGDVCVAPWAHDGHPDHDATGEAAALACAETGATLLGYLVWAWHWAGPDDIPWDRCRSVALDASDVDRKHRAVRAYRSQVEPLGDDPRDGPVLAPPTLRRLVRTTETFVVGPPTAAPASP